MANLFDELWLNSPQISGATGMLALIGHPLTHAKTPILANQWLMQQGLFGKYVLLPLQTAAQDLATVVDGLRHIESFSGAVITMPHKTRIVPLLDELSTEAAQVGAVNVIRRTTSGKLAGTLLDGEGFVQGLKQAGHNVQHARCLLKGAGGAASAIAFALARHGCSELVIQNRDMDKAQQLAERVAQYFPAVQLSAVESLASSFDIAINATSLGMHAEDELPFSHTTIEQSQLIAECVISVDETPVLKLAKEKGKATHAGLAMLQAQLDMMMRFMIEETA